MTPGQRRIRDLFESWLQCTRFRALRHRKRDLMRQAYQAGYRKARAEIAEERSTPPRQEFDMWWLTNAGFISGQEDHEKCWRAWQAAQPQLPRNPRRLPQGAVLARAYLHRDAGDGWHIEPGRDPHCDRCTEVLIVRADAVEGGVQ